MIRVQHDGENWVVAVADEFVPFKSKEEALKAAKEHARKKQTAIMLRHGDGRTEIVYPESI